MKNNIQKFHKWNDKFDVNKILNLIEKGECIKEISKILEIPQRRLSEMIKYYNISINTKGQKVPKNNNFFTNIDSEIKSYLLGYIIADGCISIEPKKRNNIIYSYSKRLSIGVSIDDEEIIKLLQFYISPKSKIKKFHNAKGALNRKESLSIRFSSSQIVDDLIKMNIKPNKTYHQDFIFDFNNIPKEYVNHFIRGFFDGDGCINKSDLGFVSTSKYFLLQIKDIICNNIPEITYRLIEEKGKTINYFRLLFNTGKGFKIKLHDYLYNNSNFYLSRKKIKFNIENTVLT
jgi:hypothetical protein